MIQNRVSRRERIAAAISPLKFEFPQLPDAIGSSSTTLYGLKQASYCYCPVAIEVRQSYTCSALYIEQRRRKSVQQSPEFHTKDSAVHKQSPQVSWLGLFCSLINFLCADQEQCEGPARYVCQSSSTVSSILQDWFRILKVVNIIQRLFSATNVVEVFGGFTLVIARDHWERLKIAPISKFLEDVALVMQFPGGAA